MCNSSIYRSMSHTTHGVYRPMARSTEPEVFTFDRLPEPHFPQPRLQQRRRAPRVMYPAKVRMYLPPAEKSPAKRWLLALCLVLLTQIYIEHDDEHDVAETAALSGALSGELPADGESASSPLFLHFRSAEETARRLTTCSTDSAPWLKNTTCDVEDTEVQEHHQNLLQNRNSPYVMAFLYPAVYHTLGSEQ